MPIRAVFGDVITRGGGFGYGPAVDIRNATNDHQIRRGNAVLEILVADLLLHLAEGRLGGRGSLGRNSSARVEVMSQFLDGPTGTKNPTFPVERCFTPQLASRVGFSLAG